MELSTNGSSLFCTRRDDHFSYPWAIKTDPLDIAKLNCGISAMDEISEQINEQNLEQIYFDSCGPSIINACGGLLIPGEDESLLVLSTCHRVCYSARAT
uniref:Peptidase A1 domain-containing protein n=1 Tax=Steinernema glaseri TaxID=37863 RepID=A0A1I7YR13_9BILA